jgi:hypothetical protein
LDLAARSLQLSCVMLEKVSLPSLSVIGSSAP